jgi:uncharacterized membrane protein
MATRQTARQPAKRPASSAASKSSARSSGRPTRAAKPAKGTATAAARPSGGQPGRGAGPSRLGRLGGALLATLRSPLGRLTGAWRAALRWASGGLSLTALIVSVLGLADAAYLTYQHFSEATSFAGCSENGAINCRAVTTSAWSHLGPFPVSVLGLAFFVFMVAVNSPWGWRAPWPAVHWARLGSVVVGIVFVLYLVWAELFRINAICLYCTGVHVLTFILFGLVIGRAAFSGVRAAPDRD